MTTLPVSPLIKSPFLGYRKKKKKMSGLPEELIEENILTRLPVKSISRFRSVSKKWCLLFQNPNFIRNHLNHANLMNKFNILVASYSIVLSSTSSPFSGHAHKIDYPSTGRMRGILGSCNGLVCTKDRNSICIWNPATGEYSTLPDAPIIQSSSCGRGVISYGFGFDSTNDDYKLVRVVSFVGSGVSEAIVYSLASNSWKEPCQIPYELDFYTADANQGIHLNGVLHWVATVCRGIKSSVTVCYDISDDIFRHVPFLNNNSDKDGNYGSWEGKLCKLQRNHMEDHIDVWTLMDNKWIKRLKITAQQITNMSYPRPVQTLQNGEILLEGGSRGGSVIRLMSYDPNLERTTALEIHGFPDRLRVRVDETYVETLVALNSGTYIKKVRE